MNYRIVKTRLIYKFDGINSASFHNYIDNIKNLAVIIKMKNGTYLSAFTEDSFAPQKKSEGKGLIISLTNKEVFNLQENNRKAILYDDYYLIFGNSEIRICNR
jgi:hypothetical protein